MSDRRPRRRLSELEPTVPVLIVGGGPVGLCTAILLARHKVRCLLVERKSTTTDHPKARAVNVRTMELFRQWGIEDAIGEHAVSQEFWRFIWCTTLAGEEIARIENPQGEVTDKSPTSRRLVAQDAVEAVLYRFARTLPLITLRFSTELSTFRDTDTGVVAELVSLETGKPVRVEARYLVAADGAASAVRRSLGLTMEGPAALSHQVSIYFRADLTPWCAHRPADIYYCTEGTWIAIVNGTTRWLGIHRYDPAAGQRREDFTPRYCAERIRRSVGVPDLDIEVVNTAFWTMGAEAASRFSQGHVFLAGDAAHRMAPTGGFGMNTGIQDAHNLAWKLAAVLHGRGGPALLDSYGAERRPVARSNATWSAANARRIWDIASAVSERDHDKVEAWTLEQQHHLCSEGRALGFTYTSTAVLPDGSIPPTFSSRTYRPTAFPGSRAPHVRLTRGGDRISTLDLFDHKLVLLTSAPGDSWRSAARALSAPLHSYLEVLTVGPGGDARDPAESWTEFYGLDDDGAVLVRPDGHVAWRCPTGTADPAAELDTVLRRVLSL